jgi:hypothetical protein
MWAFKWDCCALECCYGNSCRNLRSSLIPSRRTISRLILACASRIVGPLFTIIPHEVFLRDATRDVCREHVDSQFIDAERRC